MAALIHVVAIGCAAVTLATLVATAMLFLGCVFKAVRCVAGDLREKLRKSLAKSEK